MENKVIPDSNDHRLFAYGVLPFHLEKTEPAEKLFHASKDGRLGTLSELELQELKDKIRNITPCDNKESNPSLGDYSKYYGFIKNHFGNVDSSSSLEVFILDKSRMTVHSSDGKPQKFNEYFFQKRFRLGEEPLYLDEMDSITILLNRDARLGFVLLGLKVSCDDGLQIMDVLAQSEFFRNIGWRQKKQEQEKEQSSIKRGSSQHKKAAMVPDGAEGNMQEAITIYELLEDCLKELRGLVRFYQDRLTMLYCSTSYGAGNRSEDELTQLFFDILRVPDRKAPKFNLQLNEPVVTAVGRNIIFTGLNEGAFVLESVNASHDSKAVGNKYLPGFLLAINQREILLKTMHHIADLQSDRLMKMDEQEMKLVENLKTTLLIIQLKQIFYSVSNLHEVEGFFKQLQQVFSVELMLKENEQSVKEIYNLLQAKQSLEQEERQKKLEVANEKRSRIVNTILGAIACLGLFSFLKDIYPFYQDSQYAPIYKACSIALPFLVMGWLVWYMFGKRGR